MDGRNWNGWKGSVSYPAMNLVRNINLREEAMKDPKAIEHMRNMQALRYRKIIFEDRPFQPIFG